MKKFLTLLLTLALLVLSSAATAETAFDLTTLSDDALLALLADVQQEVANRRLNRSTRLLTGTYVGGVDIPVGTYLLDPSSSTDGGACVLLYAADDPQDAKASKLYEFVSANEGFIAYIHIEEGDVLKLPFPFTLTIHPGLVFN